MEVEEHLGRSRLYRNLRSGPHGQLVERYAARLVEERLVRHGTWRCLNVVGGLLGWIAGRRYKLRVSAWIKVAPGKVSGTEWPLKCPDGWPPGHSLEGAMESALAPYVQRIKDGEAGDEPVAIVNPHLARSRARLPNFGFCRRHNQSVIALGDYKSCRSCSLWHPPCQQERQEPGSFPRPHSQLPGSPFSSPTLFARRSLCPQGHDVSDDVPGLW